MSKNYLFLLGRNTRLSLAELRGFSDEILVDERLGLYLADNVQFTNPRSLPKAPEQLLLDQLGGVIRFGEVLGEFNSKQALAEKIREFFSNSGSSWYAICRCVEFWDGEDVFGRIFGVGASRLSREVQKICPYRKP